MTTDALAARPAGPQTFGAELRRWRKRRRVSQLELALQARTTQRHLSFIESGRSVPGRAMVLRLAGSLSLPLRERNRLLLYAGYAPAYPESALGDEDLHAARAALQAILAGHEPYPAMIINRAGELLLANSACGLFFDNLPTHLLAPPVNTRRVALHPEGLASRIINFDAWAPHVTESLQRELRHNPDPDLQALLDELEHYLPHPSVTAGNPGFAVPLEMSTPHGTVRLITTLTTFVTATDVLLSELRMEAFLPADDGTAELLRQRAAPSDPRLTAMLALLSAVAGARQGASAPRGLVEADRPAWLPTVCPASGARPQADAAGIAREPSAARPAGAGLSQSPVRIRHWS